MIAGINTWRSPETFRPSVILSGRVVWAQGLGKGAKGFDIQNLHIKLHTFELFWIVVPHRGAVTHSLTRDMRRRPQISPAVTFSR